MDNIEKMDLLDQFYFGMHNLVSIFPKPDIEKRLSSIAQSAYYDSPAVETSLTYSNVMSLCDDVALHGA
jgi:hypothetical protein